MEFYTSWTIRKRCYIENFYRNSVCKPEREYIRKEARGILAGALAKLTEDQYRRIQKHFFEGKSKVQIAKEEGVDESAVRRSLTRAYVTLRPLLEGTGISKSDFAVYAPTRYIKHRREAKILAQQYPCTTVYFLDEAEPGGIAVATGSPAPGNSPDEGGGQHE